MKHLKSSDSEWEQCKGYKKKILLDEKDLNCKGALVQLIAIEPHTNIKPHLHKKMTEVFYILEGNAIIFINDNEFHLKSGDVLTCEPNEVHGARNESDREFRYIVFKTNVEKGDIHWVDE